MSSIEAIAVSGMRFASARLAAHGSNTANLLSEGYQAKTVSGVTMDGGGVRAIVGESAQVNLEDEIIGAQLTAFMYAANAAVIYAADAAAGSLLNRKA